MQGERLACLLCLLHASFEQSLQSGLRVTASRCLRRTLEVSEGTLQGLGGLSPGGVSRGACR